MRFEIKPTPLAGLNVVQRSVRADERGSFSRVFSATELAPAGWHAPVSQLNHSVTRERGTVRGMHFQRPPHAEMKLVSCLRGVVWDVAVDLRAGSPTFGRWHAERLSDENHRAMLIPEGFAHGFQALTDDVELLYCHSAPYEAGAEGGVNPLDGRLAVAWPLPITRLSDRDRGLPALTDGYEGIRL